MLTYPEIRKIAKLCHNLNSCFSVTVGEPKQDNWADLPGHMKRITADGVKNYLENPGLTCREMHEKWTNDKIANGWVYGEKKDEDKKTHPSLVPYKELSENQKFKDYLFRCTVHFFKDDGIE